jgi:hypothetical protein
MLTKFTYWFGMLLALSLTACGGGGQDPYVTEIQANQLAIQSKQQQLQAQQQVIDASSQLANQVGPSMIRDLASLQIQNKNQAIAALLKKYGIEAKPN